MAEACGTVSGQTGTLEVWRYACPRLTLFAPSRSRALRKFPDGNFRRPLVGSRRALTSAKLVRGKASRRPVWRFLLAALHSVAERVNPGQARPPDRLSPRARSSRTAFASPLGEESAAPKVSSYRAFAVFVHRAGTQRDRSTTEYEAAYLVRRRRAVRSSRANGGRTASGGTPAQGGLSLRPNGARRGKIHCAPPRCLSAQPNFADVKARRILTSGRRKFPSGNFRSARDLEVARASAVGRRLADPQPSPFARKTLPHASATANLSPPRLLGIEECPHFRVASEVAAPAVR